MKLFGLNITKQQELPKESTSFASDAGSTTKQQFGLLANYNYTNSNLIEVMTGNKYITFGLDNLYPQLLNEMYHGSSLHASIINFKKLATLGDGFTSDITGLKGMDAITYHQLVNFFDGKRSLEEFEDLITMDYFIHGRVCIKVIWEQDDNGNNIKIINRKRLAPETVRIGKVNAEGEPLTYWYSFDWVNRSYYKEIEYNAFDAMNKSKEQIYEFDLPTPGKKFYTRPLYTAAANWLKQDSDVASFHRASIKNGIYPSFVMKHYNGVPEPEKLQKYLSDFDRYFSGDRNANRAMNMFFDGKENSAEIEAIPTNNNDTKFLSLQDAIQRNIIYAHNINPIVLGFKMNGSLGNATELAEAYKMFINIIVNPARRDIEYIINKIFRASGLSINFKIKDKNIYQ